MTTQAVMWTAAAAALALVVLAGIAEWRRNRRGDLDSAGWVPWHAVQAAGLFAAVILAVLALRV